MFYQRNCIYANDEITFYVDDKGEFWLLEDLFYRESVYPAPLKSAPIFDDDLPFVEIDLMDLSEETPQMIYAIDRENV